MGNLIFLFIGLLMIGIVLSVYEGTMPGTLPTLFFSNVRYRTLSWTFNISVSVFGGTTPLVATWLVHETGNNIAPSFYPTVSNEKEFKIAVENTKDTLWWHSESQQNK